MARRSFIVLLLFVAGGVSTLSAADKTSFGLGVGALYNGLGGNLALIKADDLKYMSVGCSEFMSSSLDGTYVTCGVGVGWLRSDILTKKNSKHGLGLNIALDYDGFHSRARTVDSDTLRILFQRPRSQGLESWCGATRPLGL